MYVDTVSLQHLSIIERSFRVLNLKDLIFILLLFILKETKNTFITCFILNYFIIKFLQF